MATFRELGKGTDKHRWKAIVRRRAAGTGAKIKTFRLREDAEGWARRKEDEVARGLWHDTGVAERTTLGAALDRYATRAAGRESSGSLARTLSVVRMLRRDLGPLLGLPLPQVTGAALARVRDRWAGTYAPATVVRRMAVLHRMFAVARKEWGMPGLANPVADVELPRLHNGRARRAADSELDAILAASSSPELANFARLAVHIATRRSELVGARWANVDLVGRVLYLIETKNGEPRAVPLTAPALAILAQMPHRADGRLFGFRGDSATQAWTRARRRARARYEADCKARGAVVDPRRFVDLRIHDLRHEATSRLALVLPVPALASITGHRDLRSLRRYYNPTTAELAAQIDRGFAQLGMAETPKTATE